MHDERAQRARLILQRGWLRDVRVPDGAATATCAGLVGVRVRVDLATRAARCDCGEPPPCEHALALLLHLAPPPLPPAPPPPPPPPPPREATVLVAAPHPDDPGRLLARGEDG
ncbi:MAG TPA: SWIM zinc finger family protein, partial [Candidatus Thermoplasmatota archaeon]|nr:SWIM zinc finger family protein [Candidatus Thermoplasmatota archaeon]